MKRPLSQQIAEVKREIALRTRVAREALEALEAYERWEANLIMDENAWLVDEGFRASQSIYDEMIECQTLRNAALSALRGEPQEGER